MSQYVPESKDPKIDYLEFNLDNMRIGQLTEKEFSSAEASGKYLLSGISYIYDTAQGKIEGPLRLRGPKMHAPGGKKPFINKKTGLPTGNFGVGFKPLKGVEEQLKFMDVLQSIYEKCVIFMHEVDNVKILGKEVREMQMKKINYEKLRDPCRRWGGLNHMLYYGKEGEIDPNSNPLFTVPVRKGDKGTMFLKPFLECPTCGNKRKCYNPSHNRVAKKLDPLEVDIMGFIGIPVIVIKDLFCGVQRKIRHELETLIVIEPVSKQAATTETETIRLLEESAEIDQAIFEQRVNILTGGLTYSESTESAPVQVRDEEDSDSGKLNNAGLEIS